MSVFQTYRALFKAISATALILGESHLSYIDSLIGNGTNFRAHQRNGYDMHIEHTLSDHGDGLVDLVLVILHQE